MLIKPHVPFAQKLKEGRIWEVKVADILRQRYGYYVVPSYDYNGGDNKAPKLHGSLEQYVIPDLDTSNVCHVPSLVCGKVRRCWIEIKFKTEPTLYRKTNTWEHGFNLRHFSEYQKVQEITNTPVYVFFAELTFMGRRSKSVFAQSLDRLDEVKRPYSGHQMGLSGMMFFPRDELEFQFCLD